MGGAMKSMKLGMIWVLVVMGLTMLLSVAVLGSEESVSAQVVTTDPVFVGAGDIASCDLNPTGDHTGDQATAKLLHNILDNESSPKTVFTTGDNAYEDGSSLEYQTCYGPQPPTDQPNWGEFKAITKPSPGNHEYQTASASGYFNYFGAAAGAPGKGYYSYDLGEWHIISLNSNCKFVACADGSAQVTWLKADLADHPNACTLAYWHHPRFSSKLSSGGNSSVKPFWDALYAAKADVVLNGHIHNYERFAPQTPTGAKDDPARGIREFVVGTGGYSLNTFNTAVTNSESQYARNYGVLKLTLHPTSYDWQFVAADGTTPDSGSDYQCEPGGTTTDPVPGPPAVISTSPATIATTDNVTATFSEEMKASSIITPAKTFKLFKKGSTTKIDATVTYPDPNSPSYTAKLDPNNSLDPGVTYKAVVTTGAMDTVGNPLPQNYKWFFTTAR
jgi:Bacterial Ig-like domain/Calcineurin-like phosphoesterase